jgi:hypothetical protein
MRAHIYYITPGGELNVAAFLLEFHTAPQAARLLMQNVDGLEPIAYETEEATIPATPDAMLDRVLDLLFKGQRLSDWAINHVDAWARRKGLAMTTLPLPLPPVRSRAHEAASAAPDGLQAFTNDPMALLRATN